MLHEILLALLGHTGGMFQNIDGFIRVKPGFGKDLLTEMEIELIERLCLLGSYYSKIYGFIINYSSINALHALMMESGQNLTLPMSEEEELFCLDVNAKFTGIRKAFASGAEEFLDLYREHILAIEQEYLAERTLTILTLHHKLTVFFQILPSLSQTIDEIEEQHFKGGPLLQLIYEKTNTGNPLLKLLYHRILYYCHQLLFHQINGWVTHGQLIDYCDEFFIHRVDKYSKNENNPDISEEKSFTTDLSQTTFPKPPEKSSEIEQWNSLYNLSLDMLPEYIPAALAEKILFIGKAVLVLQSKKTEQMKEISISELDEINDPGISLSHLEAFSKAFYNLRIQKFFNLNLLSQVIETIREYVAYKLWDLIYVRADLNTHLKVIKNFFLLGKGEFYQSFLDQVNSMMLIPPGETTETDLHNGPFKQTLSLLNLDGNSLVRNLRYKLKSFRFQFKDFQSIANLSLIGSAALYKKRIVLKRTFAKSGSHSAAIWHSLKQQVDEGFKSSFSFKFSHSLQNNATSIQNKTGTLSQASFLVSPKSGITSPMNTHKFNLELISPRQSINFRNSNLFSASELKLSSHQNPFTSRPSEFEENSNKPITVELCFILQNQKEVMSWRKGAPVSINDLDEYVVIKFRSISSSNVNQERFFNTDDVITQVGLYTSKAIKGAAQIEQIIDRANWKKIQTREETCILEADISHKLNLMDYEVHSAIIEYDGEEISVFLDVEHETIPILKKTLKLADHLKLDNGSIYLGISQESSQLGEFKGSPITSFIELHSWLFSSTKSPSTSSDGWSGLFIDYTPPWPLHLILSPDILDKYNSLFRYLFPIKRAHYQLQMAWTAVRKQKNPRKESEIEEDFVHPLVADPRMGNRILILRNHMSFILSNLLAFLQVDVIECQWDQLEKQMKDCFDFEGLRKIHDNYLGNIISQSFVNFEKIRKSVNEILFLCRNFCALVNRLDYSPLPSLKKELEKIKLQFEKNSGFIFKILSSFKQSYSSPFLSQLLLRIDYNQYYSKITKT